MSENAGAEARPGLLFFFDSRDGKARRVESWIAQVLQRRRNHETFKIYRIDVRRRPDLAERFRIENTPALCVSEHGRIVRRAELPRAAFEIEQLLSPWLRSPSNAAKPHYAPRRPTE